MPAMLTPAQVAAELGCSTRTINRMAQQRVLPALKRGRHWRISADALAAYIAANTTQPAPRQIGYREPAAAVIVKPSYQPAELDGALPDRWWETQA